MTELVTEEMINRIANSLVTLPCRADDPELDLLRRREAARAMLQARPVPQGECPTCGVSDRTTMTHCSDGFHAPGETYWPVSQGKVELLVMELENATEADTRWRLSDGAGVEQLHCCATRRLAARDRLRAALTTSPDTKVREALEDLIDKLEYAGDMLRSAEDDAGADYCEREVAKARTVLGQTGGADNG